MVNLGIFEVQFLSLEERMEARDKRGIFQTLCFPSFFFLQEIIFWDNNLDLIKLSLSRCDL